MKNLQWIALILCLISTAVAGQERMENGRLHINNSDLAGQGVEKLELRKLWQIGGEDEEFIFRSIDKVLLGKDGALYILDGISGIIYVNSAEDGKLIRQMNISGEGPGELDFANNMFLIEDDQIALLRPHPAKIVCIDYQGIPQEGVDLSGDPFFHAGSGDWQNQTLVISGTSSDIRSGQTFVARFNRSGEVYRYENYPVRASIMSRQLCEEDEYFVNTKPWAVGFRGELYLSPYWSLSGSGHYQINVYDQSGELSRIITRDFEARKRSKKEKKQASEQKFCGESGLQRLADRGIEYLVEDFDPDVLDIYAHPDGNIWVRHSRSVIDQEPGVIVSYDVFSTEGHFLKQVALVGDGDGDKDIVYFLDHDKIALVKGQMGVKFGCFSQEDILEIICYSLQ